MVDRLVSSPNTQLPYFLWDAAAISANTDATRLTANVTASASVRNPCPSVMGGALWYVTHVGSSSGHLPHTLLGLWIIYAEAFSGVVQWVAWVREVFLKSHDYGRAEAHIVA